MPLTAKSLVVAPSTTNLAKNKLSTLEPMALNFSLYGLSPFVNDLCVMTCNAKSSGMAYLSAKNSFMELKLDSVAPYFSPVAN